MRFIAAVVAFFVAWVLSGAVLAVVGIWPAGLLSFLLALVSAWLVYRKMAPKATGGSAIAAGSSFGAPTFSWKGVDVYQDQGFFTAGGRRFEIANVVRVSYETSGHRGCMGGTQYKVHIHMRDLETPRVTVNAGNITAGDNDETERNYERLAIVLNCR